LSDVEPVSYVKQEDTVIFKILGTAAAEGWPALGCICDACREAWRLGGKNVRRRAAYQLGETIHVDFGPDSYAQMLEFGLHYERLEHLLMTHSHADHLLPSDLAYRHRGYSVLPEDAMMTIHGNAHVEARIRSNDLPLEDCFARFEPVRLFEPVALSEGVTATAILADHAGAEEAVNWVLQREGRTFLQGNDTGWWPEPTWEFMATQTLDVALIECTYGPNPGGEHHLGAANVLEVRDELSKLGAITADTRVVVTHFSHNSGWLHEQYEEFFGPEGIEVAYDGMEIEF